MIKIRPYQTTDYEFIVAILKEANLYDKVWDSQENIEGIATQGVVLIAQNDSRVNGMLCIISYGTQVAFLFRLIVKKEYRNQGIASKLIDHAKKMLKEKGIKEIGLYVNASNKDLQNFYAKRQFKPSQKPYFYMWEAL